MSRVVIDPLTRVGGHLRVEVDLDGRTVSDARVTGTGFRGFEHAIIGRDARDAWLLAQRICGSAPGIHALASVRAVEDALHIRVPKNARLLRNILTGTTWVQSHVMHFYGHAVADWACALSALDADAATTATLARSLSDWPNSDAGFFQAAKDRLRVLVTSGPLANGRWSHHSYAAPPELGLMLYAHYLEALDLVQTLVTARTILGGKSPHPQTYLVGGMAVPPEWSGPTSALEGEHPWRAARHSPPPLSVNGLSDLAQLLAGAAAFVNDVLVPDVEIVAAYYPDWEIIGRGGGHYLSLGEFPLDDSSAPAKLLPAGRVMDRDLLVSRAVSTDGIAETIAHSWYVESVTDHQLLHPSIGETVPSYTGPTPPYDSVVGFERYSWIKAPRYQDDPFEVGPLARLLVGYAAGNAEASMAVNRLISRLHHGREGLFSVIGRTWARALEAQLVANRMGGWLRELVANLGSGDLSVVNLDGWDVARWPSEASGCGMLEGPQGATGHWLTIRDRRIAAYQVVDGNTWNLSPRDQRGRLGAMELALLGTPVEDPGRLLEIERNVHSFDPCAACAAH